MTPEELELFKVKAQVLALQVMLRGLYTGLAKGSPSAASSLREEFSALRKDHAKIAIPNLPPEYSDMLSSEYQAALNDLLCFIEDGLHS